MFQKDPRLFILFAAVLSLFVASCTPDKNLKWNQGDGYKWAELSPGYFGSTGFNQLDPTSTNITFTNRVSDEDIRENRNYLNGSGVAAADIDGDGLVDLYFGQLNGPNKLYKNLGGFQFKDITDEAGVAHLGYNTSGVVFEDVDGDSDPDLLITSLSEGNELYMNDGKGHFKLREESGLGDSKGSNTMTLADIDGDKDLDLYLTNYKLKSARDIFSAQELTTNNTVKQQGDSLVILPPFDQYYGIIETDGQSYRNEYGAEDELYFNDGEGHFQKSEKPESIFLDYNGNPKGLSRDWGLTAKFHDINGDMRPDLYVANDFWTPDRIWINQGDGVFREIARNAIRSMSFSSMGVDFSDINRDGATDIFVSEMLSAEHQRNMRQFSDYLDPIDGRPQYNRNSLYLNRGDHTFAEVSYFSNLEATEWSWATKFLDINLDGFEDLLIATGNGNDYQDLDTQIQMQRQTQENTGAGNLLEYPVLDLTNKMIKNNGDLTFTDKSAEWGFEEEDISTGLAVADLDNDGDPDFAVNRLNRVASVFENRSDAGRIAVQLEGTAPNTSGVGAKIVLLGSPVRQQKEITSGGDYVSGSQKTAWFAADENNANHRITVYWPDGKISIIDSVKANRFYSIEEPENIDLKSVAEDQQKMVEASLFEDVSDRIDHTHHEDPYNDFNVQSLLPRKVSRQGPGVSWIDYDKDGDEDLFITSGKGGKLGIFNNGGDGTFSSVSMGELTGQASGDQTTVLGWGEDDHTKILLGSANFEQGDPKVPSVFQFEISGDKSVTEKDNIPGILSTTGPMTMADYDGDGDIDLFVGGSFNPGKYPENATSRLFLNVKGDFVLDKVNSRKLNDIGLVSGAVFSDFDRDGDPDLLLSREWDSILLFENRDGTFNDISAEQNLEKYRGWWNGIATGDFNNDGRPDIIASNIGKNNVYQLDTGDPLKLYYQDFNMDGSMDIVDSFYEPEKNRYVTRRKMYEFDSLPFIYRNVNNHTTFAESSLDEIFGQDFNRIPSKEINTLQHMVLLNTGQGFEPHPLPAEAQFSTSFHSSVADFNNDGNEDLFLSQNLFQFPPVTPRVDAGRGLFLKGDGSGEFRIVKGQESGIMIYGEQRGAAVSDFNQDGKIDLAVSQNEGETKLYANRGEKRGYSIQLIGPESNRDAVGSGIRLVFEDNSKGPFREIQVGTGYRSQPGAIQILGNQKEVAAIEVSWFDGTTETVDIENGLMDYRIRY